MCNRHLALHTYCTCRFHRTTCISISTSPIHPHITHASIHPATQPSMHVCIHPSTHPPTYPFTRLPTGHSQTHYACEEWTGKKCEDATNAKTRRNAMKTRRRKDTGQRHEDAKTTNEAEFQSFRVSRRRSFKASMKHKMPGICQRTSQPASHGGGISQPASRLERHERRNERNGKLQRNEEENKPMKELKRKEQESERKEGSNEPTGRTATKRAGKQTDEGDPWNCHYLQPTLRSYIFKGSCRYPPSTFSKGPAGIPQGIPRVCR